MSDLKIRNISDAPVQQRETFTRQIRSSLISFNLSQQPNRTCEPLLLRLALQGQTMGGLVGRIGWDWLHIELLWLDESCRGQKFGQQLLADAEKTAQKKNCVGSCTDTFSFQALEFYRKSGYEIFGRIDDQPVGEIRYFLKKHFITD